jgi:hypothetical protein
LREPRNPFRLRESEQIDSEATFLRLFGPGVLDFVPGRESWNRIQIFRSAPGGGKTSLFRLLTPECLRTLYESRSNEDYRELYHRLGEIGVISERGSEVLGVYLSCARNYAALEDLSFDRARKDRLFFSLLNSRIVLATLRSAAALRGLNYPEGLAELTIERPINMEIPASIPVPCSGADLNSWAYALEQKVCDTIDSFGLPETDSIVGYDSLYCLSLMQPECMRHGTTRVAANSLLLLDDFHKLTSPQRKSVLNSIVDLRSPVGIWVAERLEALSLEELIAPGARQGREYNEPIVLEQFWRREGNWKRFEKTVGSIGDRRAKLNPEIQVGSFAGSLQGSLDGSEWNDHYSKAIQTISTRVRKRCESTRRYDNWLKLPDSVQGTLREKAITWRLLEIIIHRDSLRTQRRLVDLPLEETESETSDPRVRQAAELFLASEFELPYYFGFSRVASVSSSNIEQFLEVGGELFEEVISTELLRQSATLSPVRQEQILKQVSNERWESIPNSIPNGRDALLLLDSIRQLAVSETKRPNAPYPPGVTGIAITMSDRNRLIDQTIQNARPDYRRLARAISACVSNNLLEAELDRSQGQKFGQSWMILYLNRLLCLQFGLPLQYGGWRPQSLDQLCKYLTQGFVPSTKRRRR